MPNEAIIESDGKHVVYVEAEKGRYVPREIQPGLQGELYTQVLDGVTAGRAGRDVRQLLHRRRSQAQGVLADSMIATIIRNVIRFRWVVWGITAALAVASVYALRTAPLDAIPDISDPQIIVYSKWPRSPLVIETEVTEPIIRALAGSPDIQSIRGTSHMGYSFVYVILENARQPGRRPAVRRATVSTPSARPLPADANVVIGPNASSVGWIFQYALVDREGTRDLRELRLLNESAVKPALQAAAGVAEVASVGDSRSNIRCGCCRRS